LRLAEIETQAGYSGSALLVFVSSCGSASVLFSYQNFSQGFGSASILCGSGSRVLKICGCGSGSGSRV